MMHRFQSPRSELGVVASNGITVMKVGIPRAPVNRGVAVLLTTAVTTAPRIPHAILHRTNALQQ